MIVNRFQNIPIGLIAVVLSISFAIHAGAQDERVEHSEPQEVESINGSDMDSLVSSLTKKEWRSGRLNAMVTIARYANFPGRHLPAYLDGLHDADEIVRSTAASALGEMGKRYPSLTPEFLPALTDLLNDPQSMVVQAALRALEEIGPAARPSLLQLQSLAEKTGDSEIRHAIDRAAIGITAGSEDQIEHVLAAINRNPERIDENWLREHAGKHNDLRLTRAMISAFQELGKLPKPESGSAAVFRRAVLLRYLARTGFDDDAFLKTLLEVIGQPVVYQVRRDGLPLKQTNNSLLGPEPLNHELRIWAAMAISRSADESIRDMFAVLAKNLTADDPMLRLASLLTISRVSFLPAADDILDAVIRLKDDPEDTIKAIARLVELRINAPSDGPEYKTSYVYLESPTIPQAPPGENADVLLKAKITSIQKALDDRDYLATLVLSLHPAELERALVQNTSQTHDVRRREELLNEFKNVFVDLKLAELSISDDRLTAIVETNKGITIEFQWFDGQWHIADTR